jgi:hypothetical protein
VIPDNTRLVAVEITRLLLALMEIEPYSLGGYTWFVGTPIMKIPEEPVPAELKSPLPPPPDPGVVAFDPVVAPPELYNCAPPRPPDPHAIPINVNPAPPAPPALK